MAIGENIITLKEAVERYMAVSGRNSSSYRAQYLIRAVEIWKDIRNNVLKLPSAKWCRVDKTKLPYSVKLPSCASMFLSVGSDNNCDEYENYEQQDNMQITAYEETTDPVCDCDNSIAECVVATESTEEEIIIDSLPYTKTVETKISSNGDVCVKTIQPVQRFDSVGNPLFTEQKTFDFQLKMFVLLSSATPDLYKDAAVPSDIYFHYDAVDSDIHYFNGIYTSGVSMWDNSGIGDMFRAQFWHEDVGVSGYSNRGINEIGGNQADSQAAYDNWRSELEKHVYFELFDKKAIVVNSVEATHVSTVTTATEITHTVNLKITVPASSPDLDTIMLNSNSDNEWDFVGGTLVAGSGWQFSNITLTTAPHQIDSVKDVLPPVASVDMIETNVITCNLQVKECSCVEVSQENLEIIRSCCCEETYIKCKDLCDDYFKQPTKEGSLTKSAKGYFKYDEATRTIYLAGNVPSQVLVLYQTTGEAEGDEVMPNYALMTFFKGMNYINDMFSTSKNRFEKDDSERAYDGAKVELELSLPRNKFDINSWGNSPIEIFMKW